MDKYRDQKGEIVNNKVNKYSEESEFEATFLSGLKTSCDPHKAIKYLNDRIIEVYEDISTQFDKFIFTCLIVFLILLPVEIIGLMKGGEYLFGSLLAAILILVLGLWGGKSLFNSIDHRDHIKSVRSLKVEILKDLTLSQLHASLDDVSKDG